MKHKRTDKSLYDCLNEPLEGGRGSGGRGGREMRNMGPSVFVQMQAEKLKCLYLTARWKGI
jgi:hypothetical protein